MPRLSKIGAAALAAFGWTSGSSVTASYLVVAGGGGGGSAWTGGGGGAGGMQTGTLSLNPTLSYAVTIGSGGAAATSGSNSVFSTVTSIGGGNGVTDNSSSPGGNGGSGGGNGYNVTTAGGSGTSGQGNNGGGGSGWDGGAGTVAGGGGGGKSAAGANGAFNAGGAGGAGAASSISGSSVTYAGGGGGGSGGGSAGAGGAGGGGAGAVGSNLSGTAGTANTGGGGGGAAKTSGTGGQGGSGVVIISYPGAQQFGGGNVTSVGGNTIHTFTTSGTLSPLSSLTAQYLIVAGGGGAGFSRGAGGGAGGLLTSTGLTIDTNSNYVVTVGAGGAGNTSSGAGTSGTSSSFSMVTTTAVGGGGGGGAASSTGLSGGSGGGAAQGGSAGTATSGQGNAGGTQTGGNEGAGGGGGAGAVGSNTTTQAGGNGGVGIASSITGTSTYYAGGGGGGSNSNAATGTGGLGGGGNGGASADAAGSAGTANTGGGGGGGRNSTVGTAGGAGGSGVVIIAYPGSTQQMAGGTVTISGGNVIHTFTSSGYLTPIKYASRSLRFRSSASAYLNRTFATPTSSTIWTWSAWVKRGGLTGTYRLFGASTTTYLTFNSSDQLNLTLGGTSAATSTAVYRDPSSWYHIVYQQNGSAQTIYVNNVSVATGTTAASVFNTAIAHQLGAANTTNYFDGYLTEVNFIDGAALTPSSFGTFNSFGVWQPITYGGSYGNNGFYLTFGNNTSTTTLGYDTSPQGNNWTPNNFVATNATTIWSNYLLAGGSIANNAASVFNGLGTGGASAPSNGVTTVFTPPSSISYNSLEIKWGDSNNNNSSGCPLFINGTQVDAVNGGQGGGKTQVYTTTTPGTFTSISIGGGISGQYGAHIDYIKVNGAYLTDYTTSNNDSMLDVPTLTSATAANYCVMNPLSNIGTGNLYTFSNGNLSTTVNVSTGGRGIVSTYGMTSGAGIKYYVEINVTSFGASNNSDYGILNTSTTVMTTGSFAEAGCIGAYLSNGYAMSATGKVMNNGSTLASGLATFVDGDIVQIAYDGTNIYFGRNGTWLNSAVPASGTGGFSVAAGTYGIAMGASANTTKTSTANFNFGQQPFTYTPPTGFVALNTYNLSTPTIPNGAVYFATSLYTGTGATQVVTNTVNGTAMQPDFVWQKSRSAARDHRLMDTNRGINLVVCSDLQQAEYSGSILSSVNSNGFTLNTADQGNNSGETYVAWQWKANAGTNVSNTSGTITSTVSANTTAGFSVVTYTESGTYTVGHGLGVAPSMILLKERNAVGSWIAWTDYWTAPTKKGLYLNGTNASFTTGSNWLNSTTSTVFGITGGQVTSGSSQIVAYCFASIAGYSSIGTYTGNGSADGPFVYTGFRPRFVMIKSADTAVSWYMHDSVRNTYNVVDLRLIANGNNTEASEQPRDFLSNGFKIRTSDSGTNGSGTTYIYAAFAENPFKYANAR